MQRINRLKEVIRLASKNILATWAALGFCWGLVSVALNFREWWGLYLALLVIAAAFTTIFLRVH